MRAINMMYAVLAVMSAWSTGWACQSEVKQVPNLFRRSTSYTLAENEMSLSDHTLEEQWYSAEEYILTSAESLTGNLSILYPIHLEQPLNDSDLDDSPQNMTVNIVGLEHGSDNPSTRFDIQVRKCGDEIQYFLKKPPLRFAAYIFDILDSNISKPNYYMYSPRIYSELTFRNETVDGHVADNDTAVEDIVIVPYVQLRCHISWSYYTGCYKVHWYINNDDVMTLGPFQYYQLASEYYLHERDITDAGYVLGSKVQCGVSVSETNTSLNPIMGLSQVFTFGIPPQNDVYFWPGSNTSLLQLLYYTPIGCASVPGDDALNCSLKLDVIDEDGNNVCQDTGMEEARSDKCGMEIIGLTKTGWESLNTNSFHSELTSWASWQDQNGTWCYQRSGMYLKLDTAFQNRTVGRRLRLKSSNEGTGHQLWENYQLPPIHIQARHNGNYPYVYLYGSAIRCNYQPALHLARAGEYILGRVSSSVAEVQIKTEQCDAGVCFCAASIRGGHDLYIFNFCDQKRFHGLVEGKGEHLLVDYYYYSLYSLRVSFNGMYLYISYYPPRIYMDISIYTDETVFEGLCMRDNDGMFIHRDGSVSEDIDTFTNSWRVPADESLLNPFAFVQYSMTNHMCVCPSNSSFIPDYDESWQNHIYKYTGAALCSDVEFSTCKSNGTDWPESLLPEYRIGEIKVSYDSYGDDPYFQLVCEFPAKMPYLYDVYWYIKDVVVSEHRLITSDKVVSATLDPKLLLNTVQNNDSICLLDAVQCGVRVYSDEEQILLNITKSPNFYILEVSPRAVSLVRGGDADILFSFNVPFYCSNSDGSRCELDIRIYDPEDSYNCTDTTIAMKGEKGCGTRITSLLPGETASATQSAVAIITTKNDETYKLRTHFNLRVRSAVTGDVDSVWNCNHLANVEVNVVDYAQATGTNCYAHSDPNMKTFDGVTFENQLVDEFVMFRRKNTSMPVEVQIKTFQCNNFATCVCAVAVRAGGDLFVIHHCNNTHFTGFYSQKNNVIKPYYRGGMRYQVRLPRTSTFVEINTWTWNYVMNVDIYASKADFNKAEGLCGTFNGNPYDDFKLRNGTYQHVSTNRRPDDFSQSWGLVDSEYEDESLFDSEIDLEYSEQDEQVCICPNENGKVSDHDYICSADDDETCAVPKSRKGKLFENRHHQKRSTKLEPNLRKRFARDLSRTAVAKRPEREAPLTKEEARERCIAQLNVTCGVYNINSSLNTDKEDNVDDCSNDVSLSGEIFWTVLSCNAMVTKLENEIDKQPEFVEEHKDIVMEIKAASCLDNCNGRGNCTNGTCICNEGYVGITCQSDSATPPTIQFLRDRCDTSSSECKCIYLEGESYVEQHTACKIDVLTAKADEAFEISTTHVLDADVGDYTFAYCCIERSASPDFVTQYSVAVSNDKQIYGEPESVFVLDSTCQDIGTRTDGTTTATLKIGYCFIDNNCIVEGAAISPGSCRVCRPDNDRFYWTEVACEQEVNTPLPDDSGAAGIWIPYIVYIHVFATTCLTLLM